jgi:hypothetical protein
MKPFLESTLILYKYVANNKKETCCSFWLQQVSKLRAIRNSVYLTVPHAFASEITSSSSAQSDLERTDALYHHRPGRLERR